MEHTQVGCDLEVLVAARVKKDGGIPVYLQIREAVRHVVRDLSLPAGAPLPPERVMCDRVGVSKMTLRQAYSLLERDGVIQCRRGVGTFVAPSRVEKNLPEMHSFTEEMTARGKVVTSQLLSFGLRPPSAEAAELFEAPVTVYEIRRLRLGDGAPVALEKVELRADLFPNLERFDFSRQSIYQVLEDQYRIQLGWCNQEISAAPPDREHRRLLEIHTPVSLLVIRRRSYAVSGLPIELAITSYRGDIYTASIHADRVR
ncbi:MAG TPA: GntR family transcriptional regulator [Bryobacteraceae bacterium]|jgi:GntR family transcriptional regulator|nr:GntR family transcriptional regulator [Bryobacteraceae bacterium]